MKQSKFDKKYKALMLDVDGTLIQHSSTLLLPSDKVKKAVKNANKRLNVGLATSRPLSMVKDIIDTLELTSPCIIYGGAQVFDPIKNKVIYEKPIADSDIEKVFKIVDLHNLTVLDDGRGFKSILKEEDIIENPVQLWLELKDQEDLIKAFSALSKVPSISVHKAISRFNTENTEILINHTEATKQHGILKVAEILGIETHDIIGVGDGYNDFPLLMACGLRVAMGNAVDDLKEIADYIAPTVEKDGVADVIERFVLKNEKSN